LKNSKMAIRELANWQLVNLLPSIAQQIMKTQPYDLAAGPEQRDKAYAAWKQFIPDGKLPQLPTAEQKKG
jgi:hypothetical protein